jgi:hypothetical protein
MTDASANLPAALLRCFFFFFIKAEFPTTASAYLASLVE